ncbi:phage tail tape measure protein [Corynebacterium glyciniphilum]|uniref:phage tail tape measure protein n=1 Tax=Corynebacterium glyciniphilum TaxID=1404244 RepID=UPI002656C48A|nr:phage tail tape measure protein [Corynebacterium glyciniphilum]MDN6707037.1 phage tail tape measure protein [Corynebacterium glyciniphilum]
MSSVWVPILPSLKGFTQKIEGEARSASQRGGKVATEEFGKAGESSGKAMADGLKRQQALVSRASKTVGDARKAEANASGAVRTAELELQRLRDRGDASAAKIAKAEEVLADKKRRAETAGTRLNRAEEELATVRDGGEASSRKLISAEDRVVDARNKVEKAAGEVRVTELRVNEAREKAEARASSLQTAEDNLSTVRETYGKDSKEAATAERQVETARKQSETAARGVVDAENTLSKKKGELQTATEGVESASLSQKAVQEDLTEAVDESSESMEKADASAKEFGKTLDKSALAVGGLAAAAGGALVAMGVEFDDAFRTIRVGTGASGEAFEGLKESALSVMDTVPAMDGGMSQISETLADLNTRLGLTDEPLETMTGQMVALSNLGIDADIDAVSKAMNGFGIEAADMPAALDELFQVSQATGLTVTELANSAAKAGPQLRGFGFTMQDSAALVGQMDKAGLDADGTLQRLSRAMAEFADEGRDAPEALQETITSIDDFIASGDEAGAMNLAADLFGTRGAAQFVDAVKTGTLSVDDFMAATGATEDTILGVSEETRTMGESFQLLKQRGATALQPIASQLVDALIPAIETGAQKLEDFMGWIEDNQGLVKGLAVGVGVAAAAFVTWRGAVAAITLGQKAFATATALSTKGVKGMNTAMKANIFGLIATAIIGVISGLTWFFTQTELGQEIWQGFMDVLSGAWEWLVGVFGPVFSWLGETVSSVWDGIKTGWDFLWEAIQTAWTSVIKPVLDAFMTAGQVLFAIVGTAVLAPLMIAWNLLSSAVEWGWNTLIKPAWDALQTAAQWMWESVLQPIFGWIRTGWELLSTAIQWAYENIIQPAWEALKVAATWLWETVLMPIFDAIRVGWEAMSNGIEWVYNSIIKPTWDALSNALNFLWDRVVSPILGWIEDRWDDLGTAIEWVKDRVIQPVFDSIGTGLDVLKGVFETAVDGIGTVWDGLKAAAAKPVKFVIDRVWNDGILKAWNAIGGLIGLDEVEEFHPDWLGDYAHGTSNIVPGERSVGRDNMDFVSTDGRYGISLAGQEGIAHQHVVDGIGRSNWDHLNQVGRTRGAAAVREELGSFATGGVVAPIDLGGYAQGGTLQMNPGTDVTTDIQRAMIAAVSQAFPNQIVTSATRYEDVGSGYDNHMAGRAVDFAPDQGLANWIATEYPNSAELFWDPGPNIKNGSPTGAIGGHSDHVHWAMASMPDPYTGEIVSQDGPGGGGGGGGNWLYNKAKGFWDKFTDPITGLIDGAMSTFGDTKFAEIPGAFFDSTKDKVFNWIMDKIPFASGPSGSMDVSDISGPIVDQVEEVFARAGWTGQQWEDAKWIIGQESSWDPSATNPSSGAFGLFQFNPMGGDTLGTYLPSRSTDPAVQAEAGSRYIRDRYGDPTSARAFWEANGWYDSGGYLEPGVTRVHNDTFEPEPVLTGQQWRDVKGNLDFALAVAPSAESWAVMAEELTAAFNGGDWGYGELASILGEEHAEQLVNDVAAIRGSIEDELLDFFGLSNTWMTDPSLLDISWEIPGDDDSDVDADDDDHDDGPDVPDDGPADDFMANPAAGVAAVNDSLVGEVPADSASQASASEVSPDNDRVTLDRDMVVNIVMENVQTMDPDEIARETAREARRALAAFRF